MNLEYGLLNPKHQKFKKSPHRPSQVMKILFLETAWDIFAKDKKTRIDSIFVLLNLQLKALIRKQEDNICELVAMSDRCE